MTAFIDFFAMIVNYVNSLFKRLVFRSENLKFKKRLSNFNVCSNVTFNGIPIIQVHSQSRLIIKSNTLINSDNRGYHVSMFSPVKLMADKPGAIIEIGSNTRIHGSCLHAYKKISIGDNCLIAANCQLIDSSGHDVQLDNVDNRIMSTGKTKTIIIEDSVWLCTGVIVLPGVTIGRGSVIGANSVVDIDIPEMTLARGNPIKIVRGIKESDYKYT